MNRIDRLFAYLLRLADNKVVTAHDLAGRFDLSERTVYRDIAALQEIGVPIQGEAGVGYRLKPGYFVPPLLFSLDESLALSLAGLILQNHAEGSLMSAVQSALQKLRQTLPQSLHKTQAEFERIINLTRPTKKLNLDDSTLRIMSRAVAEKRLVKISYVSYKKDGETEREIEPQRVFLSPTFGLVFVEAFCRLRQADRVFRLDRITKLVLGGSFVSIKKAPSEPAPASTDLVRLWVLKSNQRWIEENQHWTHIDTELEGDHVIYYYKVADYAYFLPWFQSNLILVEKCEGARLKQELKRSEEKLKRLLT